MPSTRLTTHIPTTFIIGSCTTLLCLIGLLLNQQGTSARQIRFSIAHTQDLLADVTGLNILIRDAESAQRGYVLTGAPDYLASYEAALQHLPALYEHLRYLVADDPRQQHELVALRSIIQQKLAEMTQIIQLRTNSGEDAARSVVATDIGRFLMSQISEIMSAIAAEDGRQIVERVSAIEQADARVRQLAAFGSGLAVLLLALAGLAVSRGAARRHRLEQRIAQQRRGDLERSNTDLARQTAALERSNAELGDFAQIASHDLKGPLRGPSNNARFLHEDYAKKLDRDGVGRLLRLGYLCQRMERLIDDLLHFSRLGRQELGGKVTDLNAVIRDIEPMSETTLKECNASIVIPQELPRIGCDSVRITEVFCNLIVNAIKYNESTAKLIEIGYFNELKTGGATEEQVFYVKDNGIGVAEVFHEDIFRIFMRINAEDDDKKGIGVGLTFVRKIVERHGGRIWLDSALGKGATVYFTIAQGTAYAP